MDTAHRKIELQSPADLSYLIANATRAARTKLDLHFPPSAAPESGDDAMKKRVEELVDEYIRTTFAHAKPNLSINGLEDEAMARALADAAASGEELEAYDTRLAARILSTSAQIEALTLELANLRRTAPARAARAYLDLMGREREEGERVRAAETQRGVEGAVQAVEERGLGIEGMQGERCADMEGVWERGTRTLGEVRERIGGTTARVERARRAAGYLDSTAAVAGTAS